MWGRLDRGLDALYRWCGAVAAVLLVVLTGLILASILGRLLSVYIPGVTAIAGYVMAAGAFFAMAYTFRSGGHIRVNLLVRNFRGPWKRANDLWCFGVLAVVTVYLAVYTCRLVWFSHSFGERSQAADAVPLWIPQSFLAAGAVVFAVCGVHTFLRALVDRAMMDRIEKPGTPEV